MCLRARDAAREAQLLFAEAGLGLLTQRDHALCCSQSYPMPLHMALLPPVCHHGSPGERAGVGPCFCPHCVPTQPLQDSLLQGARWHLIVSGSAHGGCAPPPWLSRVIGPQAGRGTGSPTLIGPAGSRRAGPLWRPWWPCPPACAWPWCRNAGVLCFCPQLGLFPLSLHSEVPPTSLCLSVLALVGVPPPFWGERPACPELSL